MYEGGDSPPSTSHPVPPPFNNAKDYLVEAMIAAILHNQRRENEAGLHIVACIHAIMKKMDILIEDVSPQLALSPPIAPFQDEEEGPSEED
ncbi:unnamed protein product [Linum trigynum]|uniref:Uncharacterized protein n=1 Tax=Linum trigynum TaxID=586398 RepID=A0AAV2E7F9_9ROSI